MNAKIRKYLVKCARLSAKSIHLISIYALGVCIGAFSLILMHNPALIDVPLVLAGVICHLSVGVPHKVRIETNIVQAVKKCYKTKNDSRDFRWRF